VEPGQTHRPVHPLKNWGLRETRGGSAASTAGSTRNGVDQRRQRPARMSLNRRSSSRTISRYPPIRCPTRRRLRNRNSSRLLTKFTIEPRPIEAASTSLPSSEHRAGIVDPTRASLWPLGGGDPVDPVSARNGRDVGPHRTRLRGGRESLPQICRHPGLRFLSRRRDLQRDDVACVCTRSFAQLPAHSEPVASLAVWIERGSKGEAIDGAFNRRHASRRELRTGVLWQGKKGPRADLRGRHRPEEFRSETNPRSGCGHFCMVSLKGNLPLWDAARLLKDVGFDAHAVSSSNATNNLRAAERQRHGPSGSLVCWTSGRRGDANRPDAWQSVPGRWIPDRRGRPS